MTKFTRQRLATAILDTITVIFVLILVLLPVHAFFSTWGGAAFGQPLIWKSWKEILLIGTIPLTTIYLCLKPDILRKLWQRWINKLVLLYLILNVLFAIGSTASLEAVAAGLLMNLGFFAMFLLAQMIVAAKQRFVVLLKSWLPGWLLAIAVGLSVIAFLQVTVIPADFLTHFGYDKDTSIAPYIYVDQNPDALRAFATLRGPNELGSYLLLPLILALALIAVNRRRILAWGTVILGSLALIFTSSRSAWLGALSGVAALAVAWLPPRKLFTWLKWGTAPAIILIGLFIWLATTVPALRLAIFHSSPNDPTLLEGSTEKHWQATVTGVSEIAQNPLGQGVGSAGPASYYNKNTGAHIAENYFVQIGQELGVMGFALFIAINACLAYHFWRQRQELWPKVLFASLVGFTVISLFLHTWADAPTAMTWWAIAGLFLASDKKLKGKS